MAWPLHQKSWSQRQLSKGGKVIRNYFRASAVAVLCSGVLVVPKRARAARPSSRNLNQQHSTPAASQPSTTLTGCVYREQDVPGRSPNVAERAGVLEDYILAEVTPSQPQSTPSAGTPGADGTSGTAKSGAMYKLELIDDDKLQGRWWASASKSPVGSMRSLVTRRPRLRLRQRRPPIAPSAGIASISRNSRSRRFGK